MTSGAMGEGALAVAPFLKWAGGKRWLANSGRLPRPASFRRYMEPFLGGGAVFFHLAPAQAILSDVNAELIELYTVLRSAPAELMDAMQRHHKAHDAEHYYMTRSDAPTDAVGRAARTLYLNRTCWNGLYRVNLRGEFNVPIGTKSTVVFDKEDFSLVSQRLSQAEIRCCDFQATVDETFEGDFLFIDPPYTVKHNMNGFIKYNETLFGWNDQIRLRDAVAGAVGRGAAVVVTNADHSSVRDLYEGVCDYRAVSRSSVLASDPARRASTTEALFSANI